MRKELKCRQAVSSDEMRIKTLLKQPGYEWLLGLDWSDPKEWLVAELDEIEAMIQLAPGKPVAHLELLITNDTLSTIEKGRIVKTLLLTALSALRITGANTVVGSVPFELKGYKKVLKKRGGFVVASGNMIATRLK